MPSSAFDIYRSASGYVAVTNPVRRQILEALAEGEKELPHLVALTGKAKPTLSSVHMKHLLAQRLIVAEAHERDSRRKVYRLVAQKIGSSNVPVDTLRDAVKDQGTVSPLAARFPVSTSFQAMASAPKETDPAVLRAQAAALGRATGASIEIQDPSGLLMGLAPFLEREGVAKALRLDLEHQMMELAYGDTVPPEVPLVFLGALMAGYVEGVASAKGFDVGVHLGAQDGARRCTLRFEIR